MHRFMSKQPSILPNVCLKTTILVPKATQKLQSCCTRAMPPTHQPHLSSSRATTADAITHLGCPLASVLSCLAAQLEHFRSCHSICCLSHVE